MGYKFEKSELSNKLREDIVFNSDKILKPADVEVHGRTLVNLLGRAGNMIYKQFPAVGSNGTVTTFNNEIVKIVKTSYANDSWILNWIGTTVILPDKNYLCMADVRVTPANGKEGQLIFAMEPSYSKPHKGTPCNSSTFKPTYFVTSKNDKDVWGTRTHYIDMGVSGSKTNGDIFELKNIRLYEIDDETYEKVNTDPEYTGDRLAEKFPYVDDIKCVVNPYIESKENLLEGLQWGYYSSNDNGVVPGGENDNFPHVGFSHFIPCEPNTTYTLSNPLSKERACLGGRLNNLKADYSILGKTWTDKDGESKTITTGPNTAYLAVHFMNSNNGECLRLLRSGKARPTLVKGPNPKLYEECHNSRIMFETKLYEDEIVTRRNDGTYVKNSVWEEVTLNTATGFKKWDSYNANGYHIIGLYLDGVMYMDKSQLLIRYDGTPFKFNIDIINQWSNKLWQEGFYLNKDSKDEPSVVLTIPDSLSGWGPAYSPTEDEIGAFFSGWRMSQKNTGGQPYNNSGQKEWTKLWCGIGKAVLYGGTICVDLTNVETCPTTMNDLGFTPYKLIYKKANPVTEEVKTYGSLVIKDGVDVNISSGLVLGERNIAEANGYINNINTSKLYYRTRYILKVNKLTEIKPIDISYRTDPSYTIIAGPCWADCKEPNVDVTVDYLIYGADTVMSYSSKISTSQYIKEIIQKNVEEISHCYEELAETKRELERTRTELSKRSNPNLLINGDLQVWQRGESFINANINSYTSDRWLITANSRGACSVHAKKINGGIKLKYERKTIGTTFLRLGQFIENPEKYVGKEVTLSFKIKNAYIANHATDNINFTAELRYRNSDYTLNDGGIPSICRTTFRNLNQMRNGVYSCTGVLPSDIKKLCAIIHMQLNDVNNTNGVFELDLEWVKLEAGGYTPLISRTYAEELAMCQRYFETGHINMEYCINSYHLYSGTKFFRTKKRILQPSMKVYPDINNKELNVGKTYLRDAGGTNLSTVVANISAWNSDMFIVGGNNSLVAGKYVSLFWEADAEIY